MTTKLEGRATHFIPFNRGTGEGIDMGKGNPVVKGRFSTDYIWEDIFTRGTLSRIIANYVFVERKEKKDFMVQVAFLDDSVLYKKRMFVDTLVGFLDVGSGGPGFSLKDKVDAIDFEQKKTAETKKGEIKADPFVKVPDPETTGSEDDEERLSRIIERLNTLYGTNLDPSIVSKSIGQMEGALKADQELRKTAHVCSLEDYKLALYKAGENVMSDCLDQNENFFKLLLNNDEAAHMVLDSIARRVYDAQKG